MSDLQIKASEAAPREAQLSQSLHYFESAVKNAEKATTAERDRLRAEIDKIDVYYLDQLKVQNCKAYRLSFTQGSLLQTSKLLRT